MSGQHRSPRYPSMPLEEAIVLIDKMYSTERTNPLDREVAAKALGYSGLSGRSATVLANLIQYGLLDRIGKNEVRVSPRAVDIIHPESQASYEKALRDAAKEPELFQRIEAKFSDGSPSENSLHSFLVREGYTDTAIPAAVRAYLQTAEFAKKATGSGSSLVRPTLMLESPAKQQSPGNTPMPSLNADPINQGRRAEVRALGEAKGAEIFIRQRHIELSGIINSRTQADELIAAIEALRPMLKDDDSPPSNDPD